VPQVQLKHSPRRCAVVHRLSLIGLAIVLTKRRKPFFRDPAKHQYLTRLRLRPTRRVRKVAPIAGS
jgi:hypothetical protein